MAAKLVFPRLFCRINDVVIDYNLKPEDVAKRIYGLWPKDKIELWNGGKAGVVKAATIPIYWGRHTFTTAQGREEQEASDIGFALPVEVASLVVMPENKFGDICEQLL